MKYFDIFSSKKTSRKVSFYEVEKSSESDENQIATSVDVSDYDVTEEETEEEEEGGDEWPAIKEEEVSAKILNKRVSVFAAQFFKINIYFLIF